MFDHVTIRASDRAASERFYDTVLTTVGLERKSGEEYSEWGDFSLAQAETAKPPTRRLHIAFGAPAREVVERFWHVGTDAGYESDGEPGERPQYSEDYYGAFLLDPDGNSVEAVHHGDVDRPGAIDHLWLRVADVAASTAFYEAIGQYAGLRVKPRTADRTQLTGKTGSFSVVSGTPTENVHIAFPADSNDVVEAFHRAALQAGYRDNGGPAERREYHGGYYGAFVLDPDGNNIEVVNHNR